MVGAHQIAVAGLEILENNVAPVEEFIEALAGFPTLATYGSIALVELEEERSLV